MLKFRGRFSFPKLDVSKYTEALETSCEREIRRASKAWLKAVYPNVPVWAGTSRGSLLPLASYLGFPIPITPLVYRKGLGPSAGASQGTFSFQRIGRRFVFTFETKVPHYVSNDQFPAPGYFHLKTPTPWLSFEVGQEAFDNYLRDNLTTKIPKIRDYMRYASKVIH